MFFLPEEHSPTVNLGTNAFLSIQIVNMTPGAPSQTVPSLTSAAGALLLFSPSQVSSHFPWGSAQAAQATCCLHQHISVTPMLLSAAAQPAKATNVCRFFPECKNVDCQFYHPKVRKIGIWLCDGNNWFVLYPILNLIFLLNLLMTALSLCGDVQTSRLHLLPPDCVRASTPCPEVVESAEQVNRALIEVCHVSVETH